mmetsp:Transcript_18293/g.31302  ORF Transcript_18293/g.31302 Transcript_18293/m.31302 type:complete len:101 (-) Transcript_18293:763-1065(-)
MREIFELLTQTSEFQDIVHSCFPVAVDTKSLKSLAFNLQYDLPKECDYEDPSTISSILIQAYLHRKEVDPQFKITLDRLVSCSHRILTAMAEIFASQLKA